MVETISPQELHDFMVNDDDIVLIDVLPHGYFRKQHIPKSINIPEDDAVQTITDLFDTQRKIILYCYDTDCLKSPHTAKRLEKKGFENVYDLEVGIEGYKEAGFSVVTNS